MRTTSIRLGVSACLLGQEVRYDGGHKRDAFLTDTLGAFVEWVPVCPEVEIDLGTPRETIRLVGSPESPRLVAPRSGLDLTERMQRYAFNKARELARLDLCGYVLKKDSPSCGMERVKIHSEGRPGEKKGVGLFARALMDALPILPVEEEGRLNDPELRENFITRVFSYRRWRDLLEGKFSPGALVSFHTDHKLLLMAHSPAHYTRLGRLTAAGGSGMPRLELQEAYGALFMEALARIATIRKNTNVLQHAMGYFKTRLTADEKQELIETIDNYHRGLVPLIVPITLLRHHVRRFGEPWLARQIYFSPHPKELMLRNHV